METALEKGTTLQRGKYTIVKSLGQGSFGITYLATTKLTMMGKLGQMDTTVNVAIKEFFMSEMNSRSKDGSSIEGSSGSLFFNYRQKFKKEAENLSKLDHPNIVNVLDVFDENNTTYYVMQYIDGQSLDDYILQQSGIKEGKAVSILKEIGKAVQYMHSNKMLHLDLKPKNVMLDKDGKVYIIDFGLSKQYDSKGEPESSTKVGAGTPGYAPIEQANYREGKGFPVTMDVYALGGTMFKMLTGVRPPEASDILNEGFPLYELQEHKISDSISASVARAMAPAKKDRFQTVEDFLNSFEDEVTLYASPPTDKDLVEKPQSNIYGPSVDDFDLGNVSISYRWWAILVLIIENVYAWFMLTQSREIDWDFDGIVTLILFIMASLFVYFLLLIFKEELRAKTWRLLSFLFTIACFANSLMLPMWNGSVTGAFFSLSIGLSVASSLTLFIKRD